MAIKIVFSDLNEIVRTEALKRYKKLIGGHTDLSGSARDDGSDGSVDATQSLSTSQAEVPGLSP